jgi:succinate-semialdehyde dehydrogenase/glutarate-semialdehyde dehydrogenase
MIRLNDRALWRERGFIAGDWMDADSGQAIDVHNPATGEKLGSVPNMGAVESRRAIDAAHAAMPAWSRHTAAERARLMRKWFELMMANQEDLAVIMTAEQGKPLAESRGEIAYAASFIEWFAEEAKRVYGDVIPGHQHDKRILVLRQPIGVVAAITPWNFPAAMITRKAAPAIAAGCTIVVKPAQQTPFSALAMAELAARAGIPAGVFNVVTGDAKGIGGEFTGNDKVRKLSFTGSTPVGKLLMAQCAGTVKKVALELGGNAPFLVLEDADLDAAVAGAIASKHRPDLRLRQPLHRPLEGLRRVHGEAHRRGAQAARGRRAQGRNRPGAAHRRQGAGQGGGTRCRCPGQGCESSHGRPAPRAGWHILRAHGAHPGVQRNDAGARGNLRPRGTAVPRRHR